MQLIFIYGPPAVGKLIIAQKLVKITNFKLYHNHLVHNLVTSIFDHDTHRSLMAKINTLILSVAMKEQMHGIVITNCYIHPDDDEFIDNIINIAKENNCKINFVQIVCNRKTLFKRVVNQSRKKYGKLKNKNELKNLLKEKELFHKIQTGNHLFINNTNISANNVANKIKKFYNL